MLITTSFEQLEKGMGMATSLLNDKMLHEEYKNVIVWIHDGKVHFCSYTGNVISATELEAEVKLPNGEAVPENTMFQLRAKDINDVVSAFKGLKRTKVDYVELAVQENGAILHLHEVAIDSDLAFASEYSRESKFTVAKPRMKDLVEKELNSLDFNIQGDTVESLDLILFLDALLPTVMKEKRESSNNIMFGAEHIYTVLQTYTAVMPNRLVAQYPSIQNFRLQSSMASFVRSFIAPHDNFTLNREEGKTGEVFLVLKAGSSIARIRCADMSRAFDISSFVTAPDSGVVVDKVYLTDVLKRVSLNSDSATIQITIENGVGTLGIKTKAMTQSIPVLKVKGEGSFSFAIRPDMLASMVFSHLPELADSVFMYLEQGTTGNITMAVSDSTTLWQTKTVGLTPAKFDALWG